jgi:hypothetical protein
MIGLAAPANATTVAIMSRVDSAAGAELAAKALDALASAVATFPSVRLVPTSEEAIAQCRHDLACMTRSCAQSGVGRLLYASVSPSLDQGVTLQLFLIDTTLGTVAGKRMIAIADSSELSVKTRAALQGLFEHEADVPRQITPPPLADTAFSFRPTERAWIGVAAAGAGVALVLGGIGAQAQVHSTDQAASAANILFALGGILASAGGGLLIWDLVEAATAN